MEGERMIGEWFRSKSSGQWLAERNFLRPFFVCLLLSITGMTTTVFAQTASGPCNGGCEPDSRRPYGVCYINIPGTNNEVRPPSEDLEAEVAAHCAYVNAQPESFGFLRRIPRCGPVISLPWNETGGWDAAVYASTRTVETRNGVVTFDGERTTPGAFCHCAGSRNNVATGTDNHCYCKPGYKWVAAINNCVLIQNRYHDKPPAACERGQPKFGNPLNPMAGTKHQSVDLGLLSGLGLTLDYDTRNKLPNAKKMNVAQPAAFGELWTSSLHKLMHQDSAVGTRMHMFRGGAWTTFSQTGAAWVPAADIADRLVPFGGGVYHYYDANDSALEVFVNGRPSLIQKASGQKWTLTYSTATTPATVAPTAGLPIELQDQFGRAALPSSTSDLPVRSCRPVSSPSRTPMVG
jgi:hypothetical protein